MVGNYKRLTLSERKTIGHLLDQNISLKQIARDLGRSTGTISREIQRNSTQRKTGGSHSPFNECGHRMTCTEQWLCEKEDCRRERCCGCEFCQSICKRFEPEYCTRLERPPYVCNGCPERRKCTLAKFVYNASVAHGIYEDTLVTSRSGVALSEKERKRIDDIVTPLIARGQSPYHICLTHKDELMISDKTLYKYIAANFFGAASTDLIRKVGMRPRRKKRAVKVERSCRKGRTMEDLDVYLSNDPDTDVVEMDSVIGAKGQGEKVLLTLYFTHSHLMLAFIRNANTARSVKQVFDELYEKFGKDDFRRLIPILRTDNGPEFTAPTDIETDGEGNIRTRVFYCDPYQSNQKAGCENAHRLIRMIIPKGTSMNELTQDDVNLMMSHINSYARKVLGGQTPFEVFLRQHKKINGSLEKLGLKIISAKDILLKPRLFK